MNRARYEPTCGLRHGNRLGYWLGGRPSAAVPRGSARNRADSARFRADPANFRQNYFLADSAKRPANVRRSPPDSARSPPRTGGRVHSRNVRRQKLTLRHCSSRKIFRTERPSAADDSAADASAADESCPRIRK